MTIVFACPKCNYTLKAPEEKGGAKVKCLKCGLPLEVPYARARLIDAWEGVEKKPGSNPGVIKPTSKSNPPRASMAMPPRSKAEDLLEQAALRKDAGDVEAAIGMVRTAYDHMRKENRAFPVDTYLILPMYLQQAGHPKECWDTLTHLLFRGYPNQVNDHILIAQDRAKVLDKMRQFLEHDDQKQIAAVYEAFSMVFKGISLYREQRARELKVWFSRENCTEYLHGLKKYKGNLGRVHELHAILVDEIGQYPDLDFERMGQRVESALARG